MSASSDGSIRQWIINGEPVRKPWKSDGRPVSSLAVSPDQTMVISGSGDGRLRLWNVKEGSVVGDPWEGHSASVRCINWSPNTREVASGSQDGTIRRWNPNTGRQIAPPIKTGHDWVYAVKYSPQGDKFASGGYDGVIRAWSKDGELLIEIKGHDFSIYSLCWSKDGAHISSSASSDCSVRIWDLNTNKQAGDPLLHGDELWALAILSDGRYIASAGLDKKIYVRDLEAALKQSGDRVHVRAYIAVISIISNCSCIMAMHSRTGS
ncbi:WD40 repeat-like protein [Rhizopogon salebrosus TDB-379]|nr:WD40 repeat-like protein [Rhizopogon salebrosus TDB-379]